MAGKMKEDVVLLVRQLITSVTGLQEGEQEFEKSTKVAVSCLRYHHSLDVNRHAVKRSVDGMITKFKIHGQLDNAEQLSRLFEKYLQSAAFQDHSQYDIEWSILSLLLNLADNPTSHHRRNPCASAKKDYKEKEMVNWKEILLEGEDLGRRYFDEPSDDDEEAFSDDQEYASNNVHTEPALSPIREFPESVWSPNKNAAGLAYKCHRDGIDAEQWLFQHIQHSWWQQEKLYQKVDSSFPSARLAEKWDQFSGDRDPLSRNNVGIDGRKCVNARDILQPGVNRPPDLSVSTISEYKVLREVLWMLQLPTTTYIFQETNDGDRISYYVKADITIPSLTKGNFYNLLTGLCQSFTMIKCLQVFGDSLKLQEDHPQFQRIKNPPHTYEAYFDGLYLFFLSSFYKEISELERKVKLQNDIYTLKSVVDSLTPRLLQLKNVYVVHMQAAADWKSVPNWFCATRLLSVLYESTMESIGTENPTLLLKIFLKSLQPYVDMIDVWLTDGRLEDWRDEFIIQRNSDVNDSGEDFWDKGFTVHPFYTSLLENDIKPLDFLQIIIDKILHAGKNIELLNKLDRLPEVRRKVKKRGSLYEEFLKSLLDKITEKEEDIQDVQNYDDTDSLFESNQGGTEMSAYLLRVNDPFLVKAFENILFFKEEPEKTPEKISVASLLKSCKVNPSAVAHMRRNINENLVSLIDEKHKVASHMVKEIVQDEFNLWAHISLIRRVFLMEAGDLMHTFCSYIFNQLNQGDRWANGQFLTNYLEDCICSRYPEAISRFSIVICGPENACYGVDSLDIMSLHYTVGWPVTLILNSYNMERYNKVFLFLLKIKWSLWSLQKLRFSEMDVRSEGSAHESSEHTLFHKDKVKELSDHSKIRRVELLRSWLLHFIGSVHSYIMGRVLHSSGIQLEKQLEEATDLDSIVQTHNKYVNIVHHQCLQMEEVDNIRKSILRVLNIALSVHSIWKQGISSLSSETLIDMENSYVQHHTFLASLLGNVVQRGTVPHYPPFHIHSSEPVSSSLHQLAVDDSQVFYNELSWQSGPPSMCLIPSVEDPYCVSPTSSQSDDNDVCIIKKKYLSDVCILHGVKK